MPVIFKSKEGGFTIVELMIAMVVGLIVLGGLSAAFINQRKVYSAQEQVTEMTQSTRAAMDMMIREIRMAGYNPTGATLNGVIYNAAQLQVLADLDGDGTTTGSNENITYTYDGTNLRINQDTGGGVQPFADNIVSFTFDHLDSAGNLTSVSADIRQLRITITGRTSSFDPDYPGGYRTYTLKSTITPKNLNL